MKTVLLDTHTLHWSSADRSMLSRTALRTISTADELAVASITWFELAYMAQRERIVVPMPILTWLQELAADVRTVPVSPAIAATAAALPSTFPGDPVDRVIYATAIEQGWPLVTRDERMRAHPYPRKITIW